MAKVSRPSLGAISISRRNVLKCVPPYGNWVPPRVQEKSGHLKACSLQEEPTGGVKESNTPQVCPRSPTKCSSSRSKASRSFTRGGFAAAEITKEGLLIGKRKVGSSESGKNLQVGVHFVAESWGTKRKGPDCSLRIKS